MSGQADEHGDQVAMSVLLDGLLVGAGRMMESAQKWAAHLAGDSPTLLAERFVAQLREEWFDVPSPDAFCGQIKEQVRGRLAAWHPGWPHLWAHVLRVTGAALALAAEANLDLALAYLTAICHDVAKLDEFRTGDAHEEAGAAFAGQVLDGHLAPAQIAAIQAAIRRQGNDPLVRILHDADKLDKIGAVGIVRRVSTGTDRSWLPVALGRVQDDTQRFPLMQFERSRELVEHKRAFQAWFLPLA